MKQRLNPNPKQKSTKNKNKTKVNDKSRVKNALAYFHGVQDAELITLTNILEE